MRVLNGPKTWLIHAGTQALGMLLATVGAGMGIFLAKSTNQVSQSHLNDLMICHWWLLQLDSAHAIIGLFMFAMLWLIAAGGFLQHLAYRKHQRRTIIGHVHMWIGRAIITLAFINGGLGLQLAGEHGGALIAYGVIAALIWLAWMAITFLWAIKGKRLDSWVMVDEMVFGYLRNEDTSGFSHSYILHGAANFIE
jgi:hypothetical protein